MDEQLVEAIWIATALLAVIGIIVWTFAPFVLEDTLEIEDDHLDHFFDDEVK